MKKVALEDEMTVDKNSEIPHWPIYGRADQDTLIEVLKRIN